MNAPWPFWAGVGGSVAVILGSLWAAGVAEDIRWRLAARRRHREQLRRGGTIWPR